jgi:epsilon-lactone hydrolase
MPCLPRPIALAFTLACLAAPGPAHADTVATETATLDDQGRVHVDRTVSAPETLSPEGQALLTKPPASILSSGMTVAEQREKINARQLRDVQVCLGYYPATLAEDVIAGVPVRIVTPTSPDPAKADRVLINIHGGAFRVDTGSMLESVPIASLTHTKVVSVLYRMAPENPFPTGLEDVVAVYRELLKTHAPHNIAIYGTSAGAVLTAETAARLHQLGLPLPAALGIFSGLGDFSRRGDSLSLFSLQGLSGRLMPRTGTQAAEYVGKTDPKDPILSPTFSDLHGMPPTLFMTSTRDALLSGTVMLHQAFLDAGVDARLVVFEALPHAFWLDARIPESRKADAMMAAFLDAHLGH